MKRLGILYTSRETFVSMLNGSDRTIAQFFLVTLWSPLQTSHGLISVVLMISMNVSIASPSSMNRSIHQIPPRTPNNPALCPRPNVQRVKAAAMCRAGIPHGEIARRLNIPKRTIKKWGEVGRRRGDSAWRKSHVVDGLWNVHQELADRMEAEGATDEQRLLVLLFLGMQESSRPQLLEFLLTITRPDPLGATIRRRKLGKLGQTTIPGPRYPELVRDDLVDLLAQIADLPLASREQMRHLVAYRQDDLNQLMAGI